jgi:uncharacterized protein (TIGR03643 family)
VTPEQLRIEEIIDLAMQDTVSFQAISEQFGITVDEVVAVMRKNLNRSSYRRWKERRSLASFRKHSSEKPTKHRTRTIASGKKKS